MDGENTFVVENTVTYFDEMSTDWTQKYQSRTFKERLDTVLAWLPKQSEGLHVLDYGCGSGVFSAELLKKGFSVTSVDASPGMVAATQKNLATLDGVSSGQYQVALVDSQDFSGEYQQHRYDGICCMGVIEYVPEDDKLLEILASLVKPGGFLMVSLPNQQSVLRGFERFVYNNPSLFKALGLFSHLTAQDAYLNYQAHQYTVKGFTQNIVSKGFKPVHHKFHVSPSVLNVLATSPAVGMTMILMFEKTE